MATRDLPFITCGPAKKLCHSLELFTILGMSCYVGKIHINKTKRATDGQKMKKTQSITKKKKEEIGVPTAEKQI